MSYQCGDRSSASQCCSVATSPRIFAMKASVRIVGAAAALAWLAGVAGFGQGIVIFKNDRNTRVFYPDCVTPVEGPKFVVGLWAGALGSTEPSLVPVTLPIPLATGVAAGLWNAGNRGIPFVAPGERAVLQARVWEAAAGSFESARAGGWLYGMSGTITLATWEGITGIAPETTWPSAFCLVPEPATVALLALGGAALLSVQLARGPSSGQRQRRTKSD